MRCAISVVSHIFDICRRSIAFASDIHPCDFREVAKFGATPGREGRNGLGRSTHQSPPYQGHESFTQLYKTLRLPYRRLSYHENLNPSSAPCCACCASMGTETGKYPQRTGLANRSNIQLAAHGSARLTLYHLYKSRVPDPSTSAVMASALRCSLPTTPAEQGSPWRRF